MGDVRTSIRLEPEFWYALSEIAAREDTGVDDICTAVVGGHDGVNRTAAIRVYIAEYFRERIQHQERSNQRGV